METRLKIQRAGKEHLELYYHWANDPVVRNNSYSSEEIDLASHSKWFNEKIIDPSFYFFLFFDESNIPAGQVRIQRKTNEILIGISIDKKFRGKSLAPVMLEMASQEYFKFYPLDIITAYIKKDNLPSYLSFEKAGFILREEKAVNGFDSFIMIKKNSNAG